MSSFILNITFDCRDAGQVAQFWAELTGWPVSQPHRADEYAVSPPDEGRPPDQGRPRLYFVPVPEGKTVKNRTHLDIVPADRTQDDEIARLTGLGASVVTDRRPEVGWVTLADPEGNEFCVEG